MPNRAVLLSLCVVLSASLCAQEQPSSTIGGPWKATFADSVGSGSLEISLNMQPDGTVSGTYKASTGGSGTITGTLQGQSLRFILTQTLEACPGSYTGTLTLADGRGSGTYWGNDCQGKHENGVISMTRGAPGNVSALSEEGPGQRSHVCAWLSETPPVFREAGSGEVVDHLGPQEEVALLRRIGTTETNKLGTWAKVRSARGIVGYVNGGMICEGPPPVPASVSPPQSRPSLAPSLAPADSKYPLALKVLQTEQVPYTVQVGGGQVNTNCSIVGTVNTQGSATTVGNFTNWTASSYPNLHMVCSSYQAPPMGWRHVLSAMLAVGSDGNAYIIACDAAWRWSKCRGLRTGDAFEARWAKRGLSVVYTTEKGKRQEATYSVLVSKSIR